MMVMAWRAIGFWLACHKAQLSHRVGWIGYEIEDQGDRILARIKAEFMTTLAHNIDQALMNNVIRLKELRSLTGCINHVASLILAWRPFIDSLLGCMRKQGW